MNAIVGKMPDMMPSWAYESSEQEKETEPLVSDHTNSWEKDNAYASIVDKKQERKDDDNNKDESAAVDNDEEPEPPPKHPCLHVFGVFEMFAIVTCVRLLLMQLIPLFLAPLNQIGLLQVTLRIYVSLCCLLFVMVELEVPIAFIQDSTLLQSYISRGFLYSFVGLIGTEESYAVFVQELKAESYNRHQYEEFHVAWESLFTKGASLIMVVLGFVYMILGVLCIRGYREHLKSTRQQEMDMYQLEKLQYEQRHNEKKEPIAYSDYFKKGTEYINC